MPFSVNDIRTYSGTGGVLYDPAAQTLQPAGQWHAFKSRYDVWESRRQNTATMAAIREAFSNDPDLADDLKAKADKLLDDVRVDRSIGMAQIRSILDEVDKAAPALDERIALRLAAERPKLSAAVVPAGGSCSSPAVPSSERTGTRASGRETISPGGAT